MRAKQMSVEQKVGQLLMIGYPTLEVPGEMETWIRERQIGNVILFSRNIGSVAETFRRVRTLQRWAKEAGQPHPLLIGTDQENGVVARLMRGATRFPGAMALGATGSPEWAGRVYAATGEELRAAGITVNFAPVVDVNNNPANPVIGVRSFGAEPEAVGRFGESAVQGLLASGVVAAIKHFPGHGDTSTDSHEAIPVLRHDWQRLSQVELVPFRRCIAAKAPMVMIGHVSLPTVDESGAPASISRRLVTDVLRGQLGFQGVAITDCLEMAAIANSTGVPEAAVQAIQAGVDMVLVSHTPEVQQKTYDRLAEAIRSGEIPDSRVQEAVERITGLKQRYLSWEQCLAATGPAFDRTAHERLAKEALAQAVTLVKNDQGLVPLPEQAGALGVILPGVGRLTQAEDQQAGAELLVAPLQAHRQVHAHFLSALQPPQAEIEQAVAAVAPCDTVIVFTYNAHLYSGQAQLVQQLSTRGKKVVAVALRNPYDLTAFPEVDAFLAVYDQSERALGVVADVLFGKQKAVGRLPVSMWKQQGHF